jgi:hypothetical protein
MSQTEFGDLVASISVCVEKFGLSPNALVPNDLANGIVTDLMPTQKAPHSFSPQVVEIQAKSANEIVTGQEPATLIWAQNLWNEKFEPGQFWEWLNMQGKRGILAAAILFGPDEGELRLLELAAQVPARKQSDLLERAQTIHRLWRSFELKTAKPVAAKWAPSDLVVQTVDVIMAEALKKCPKPRWSPNLANALLTIVLAKFEEGAHYSIPISSRSIAKEISKHFELNANNRNVNEMIMRFSNIVTHKPSVKTLENLTARSLKSADSGDPRACILPLFDYMPDKISGSSLFLGNWFDGSEFQSKCRDLRRDQRKQDA